MSGRILVVDDDKDHAESIADVLQLRGFEVEVAFSGEQALQLFRAAPFDVSIMDVKLPGINGVEAFFEFRKIRPGAQIIMMTGFSVEQLIASAVANGAAGVLHKPFAMTDLIDALNAARPDGLVLAADPDQTFAQTAVDFLAETGYCPRLVRNGEESLRAALCEGADCLILDSAIPILSGIEIHMRLGTGGCLVPKVLVSACDPEFPEQLAQEQILIKPFDPVLLLDAVTTALESPNVRAA
jgi:two-component system, NtrC family, response regulator HydG